MWRACIVSLCLLAAGLGAASAYAWFTNSAAFGFVATATGPFRERIDDVIPGFPAARAALRPGDIIDRAAMSPADRVLYGQQGYPGKRLQLVVVRDGRSRPVTLVEQRRPFPGWTTPEVGVLVGYTSSFWLLAFAALIGVRCAGDRRARLMSLTLALDELGTVLAPNNFVNGLAPLDLAAWILSNLALTAALCTFALYALTFVPSTASGRRFLRAATLGVIAVDGAIDAFLVVALYPGWFDPTAPPLTWLTGMLDGVAGIAPLACVFVALWISRGDARSRLAWSALPLSVFQVVTVVTTVLFTFAPQAFSSAMAITTDNIAVFASPIGLTYALFSRRALDIGFALNRAAVFAATSFLLAGSFTLLQWGAGTVLSRITHEYGMAAQALVILIVYYVVRLSRQSTDHIVTRVFFASRERRLEALRSTLRALDEIDDAEAIAPFAVDELRAHAGIEARVLLTDADGSFSPAAGCGPDTPPLAKNDALAVRLRAERRPVFTGGQPDAREVACPLLVRGRLRGILFCRSADGAELAPDQTQLLAALANRVATNRDDVLADALRRESDALRRRNDTLEQQIAQLQLAP